MAQKCLEVIGTRDRSQTLFLLVCFDRPSPWLPEGNHRHPPQSVGSGHSPYLPDHPNIREELALYYDEIHRFDTQIGTLRKELESQGVWDDTLVLYLSDNGMPFPRPRPPFMTAVFRPPSSQDGREPFPQAPPRTR